MDGRPKRLKRQPAKILENTTPTVVQSTRKAQAIEPTDELKFLLQNPKSALTRTDISHLINPNSWDMLSPDSQAFLSTLLPPTAFRDYKPCMEPYHPSAASPTSVIEETVSAPSSPSTLEKSIFTDSHFLAAAHTFQDHIYLNWRSDSHAEKVRKYEKGVCEGSLSAPWKDEIWERDNVQTPLLNEKIAGPLGAVPESSARAGGAAEVKLVHLATNSVLLVGDVIAYKRHFTNLDLVVEKDIQSIHPTSHALNILAETGQTQYLSAHLLQPNPAERTTPTLAMTITSPSMLENGLLDVDGRVEKSKRPNGNAWKNFTVWRWRGTPNFEPQDSRAGRENHGTLFYLRGCYYHDR